MRKQLVVYGSITALIALGALLALHFRPAGSDTRSSYVAQLESPVRGLSAQEVDDLLNGRGAGYARTAELNNYPGPRHVLDLQQELGLSPDQVREIQAVFDNMQTQARRIGQQIVHAEKQLSAAFAGGTISEQELQAQTAELATLYGALRAVHLRAHVQITPFLSADQIAEYNTLRGYTKAPSRTMPGEHQRHNH